MTKEHLAALLKPGSSLRGLLLKSNAEDERTRFFNLLESKANEYAQMLTQSNVATLTVVANMPTPYLRYLSKKGLVTFVFGKDANGRAYIAVKNMAAGMYPSSYKIHSKKYFVLNSATAACLEKNTVALYNDYMDVIKWLINNQDMVKSNICSKIMQSNNTKEALAQYQAKEWRKLSDAIVK